MADTIETKFHWADYLVFVLSLVLTAAIGLFFSCYKRKETSSQELLVASRSMHFLPVVLSMVASLLNGIFVLGGPADVHYYGVQGSVIIIGWILAAPVAAHVILPTFHRMELTSAYEYLELRYNYLIRAIGSLIFSVSLLLFLAVVLYAPALAFSTVTSLSLPAAIVITGSICTLYTCLGGIKAVIYTDTVQIVILIAGLITLVAVGAAKEGGIAEVWDIAEKGGRLNYIDVDPDPRNRYTFWGQIIGQWVIYVGIFMSNQMMIQRFMTVADVKGAQLGQYVLWLLADLILIIIALLGLTIYARYKDCDPLIDNMITGGQKGISEGDKIVPYFLMDVLGDKHGLPGLFTAAVFAAALSSVSSAVNSLAAVVLEDFIKPGHLFFAKRKLSEKAATVLSTVLALVFGVLTIGLSFAAEHMTDKLIEVTSTIWSLVGGPLAGIFIMGFFFPWVNTVGAFGGLVVSLGLSLWLAIGGIINKEQDPTLPLGTCGGPRTPSGQFVPKEGIEGFYQISFAWYGVFSIGICIVVGNIVSIISHIITKLLARPDMFAITQDPRLYYNCAANCYCYCPKGVQKKCQCGIPHDEEESEQVKFPMKKPSIPENKVGVINETFENDMLDDTTDGPRGSSTWSTDM